MKSFTDIDQSRKLAEILPLESADMSWASQDDGYQKYYKAVNKRIVLDYEKHHWIPCWSLSALLNVMPEEIHLVGSSIQSYWYCECVDSNIKSYLGESADNPIDACVNMIVKLKEQKLL